MDQLLQDVKLTVCHLDDFHGSGGSAEEHLAILEEVFRYLKEHGITLNPAKCTLFQSGLDVLGHWIVFVSSSENDVSIDAKSPSYLSHTVEVISGASQLLSVPSFGQIW